MKVNYLLGLLALLGASTVSAQDEPAPKGWPHMDLVEDGYPGMSTTKTYKELLANKANQTVIVAVIDSGVDPDHEDLKDVMWTNPGEIAGNGIDDDNNGYIDDIHGWNFIGGKDGKNVNAENLEIVRLYNKGKERFEGVDEEKLSKSARKEYEAYLDYKKQIEEKRASIQPQLELYTGTLAKLDELQKAIGKDMDKIMLEDVLKFTDAAGEVGKAAGFMAGILEKGDAYADVYHQIEGAVNYYTDSYNHNWNPDFDARHIVGDNPADTKDRNYGNDQVEGLMLATVHTLQVSSVLFVTTTLVWTV